MQPSISRRATQTRFLNVLGRSPLRCHDCSLNWCPSLSWLREYAASALPQLKPPTDKEDPWAVFDLEDRHRPFSSPQQAEQSQLRAPQRLAGQKHSAQSPTSPALYQNGQQPYVNGEGSQSRIGQRKPALQSAVAFKARDWSGESNNALTEGSRPQREGRRSAALLDGGSSDRAADSLHQLHSAASRQERAPASPSWDDFPKRAQARRQPQNNREDGVDTASRQSDNWKPIRRDRMVAQPKVIPAMGSHRWLTQPAPEPQPAPTWQREPASAHTQRPWDARPQSGQPRPAPQQPRPQPSVQQPQQQMQRPSPKARGPRQKIPPPPPKIQGDIQLPSEVTVAALAQLLEVKVEELEKALKELGDAPSSVEDAVSPGTAELAAMTFGRNIVLSQAVQDRNADAQARPPVVTIMGHVDHGKTTLLDALRKTAVAAGEAGGITQHIGAFQVEMPDSGGLITFLDTPGHAAFTAMRARGAAATDIVVLVVAADDGVMPQTVEALQHAQSSGCPIVVALTKCDKPGANPDKAKQELVARGVELEEAGGNVQVVETAAPAGLGLIDLEEALLFQAELLDLKASPTRPADGVVVEAKMDKGQGPVATVIVKRGTLQVGQFVVLGSQWGKVRAMKQAGGQTLKRAVPGQPVEVSGLRGVPMAGDDFMVLASEDRARRLSQARQQRRRQITLPEEVTSSSSESASDVDAEAEADRVREKQLVLVIKADVQGSAEAVQASVEALSSPVVTVKAASVGVGPVSVSDVQQASAMGARILAFNVKSAVAAVDALAKKESVPILRHRVIYSLLQEVGGWMAELAPHVEQEVVLGEAEVLQTFTVREKRGQQSTTVAGCRVHTGNVSAGERFRVLRSGDMVHEGRCTSLKRHKLDVQRVGKGTDCGVLLDGFDAFQPGDVIHCITTELKPQAIEDVVTLTSATKAA